MKKQSICVSLMLVLSLAFSARQASAFLIDFGLSLPGAPTGSDVILTTQLSSFGLTFSTTDPRGVIWHGPTGGASFPFSITAGGICGESESCSVAPIRVDINTGSLVTEVSIRGLDGGFDIDTMVMKAFGSGSTLLDTETITNIYTDPGLVSAVTGANIAFVTFEVTGTTIGGQRTDFPHGLFFDDLCIGSCDFVAVPEPSTLILLSSGLLGFWYFGGRKRMRKLN